MQTNLQGLLEIKRKELKEQKLRKEVNKMEVFEKEYRFDSKEEMEEFLKSKGLAEEIAKTIQERMGEKNEEEKFHEEIEEKIEKATERMSNVLEKMRTLHNKRGYTNNQWLKIIKAHNKCAQILEETYAEVKKDE